jgi:hypothetical protein
VNLVPHLPPETEAKLREQAAAVGKAPEELALIALEERLAAGVGRPVAERKGSLNPVPPQQCVADFRKWAEGHCRLEHEADDRRESVYSGRGE